MSYSILVQGIEICLACLAFRCCGETVRSCGRFGAGLVVEAVGYEANYDKDNMSEML